MSSLDFDLEQSEFRKYYETHRDTLDGAMESFQTLIRSLLAGSELAHAAVVGRIKDRDECIRKFARKYRANLESSNTPYSIKDHITDLVGLRVICLYEDEVQKIKDAIYDHFEQLGVTDKISQIEGTESSFGYKGLHLDLRLNGVRSDLPEYKLYRDIRFEVQIRTIVQDSWSNLDHKIKYKKSIPNSLKRRINTLAALFELADREFRQVRDATKEEIERAESEADQAPGAPTAPAQVADEVGYGSPPLNAFRFLKIAKHYFSAFNFEDLRVDAFTSEIVQCKPDITRNDFDYYMRQNIAKVKKYQAAAEKANPSDVLTAYGVIRHCLYLGEPAVFGGMLSNAAREPFKSWLAKHAKEGVKPPAAEAVKPLAPDGVKQPDGGSPVAALP